ncbi:MAG: F0F1 ATP synthase subunit A, partial [Armatimonadetes bacterium]|nr:F0F1 ATP synthase subunit A [Armatimonadota bacterium]
NLIGLVPGMLAPTSSLNTTVALGLCAIVAVHFYAIRDIGFKTWASHFMGEPKWLAPLMIPLHIVGELARPLSLSLRLFGNIFGEETVLVILAGMSPFIFEHILQINGVPLLAVPIQLPMLLFGVFTSLLQALVFSMLVCIYITVTIGEHHAHEHDDHEAHEAHEGEILSNAVPV